MSNSQSIYISEELIIEILKYLPAKALIRFMSVSKFWYSYIKSPNFISSHLNLQIAINNTDKGRRYLLYQMRPNKYMLVCDNDNFDMIQEFIFPEELSGVGYYNGIVCFGHTITSSLVLWNISLNRTLDIGMPHFGYEFNMGYTYGFGFDASSNDYKFVWLNYLTTSSPETRLCGGYVYSLNVGYWRVVNASLSLGTGDSGDCSLHHDGVYLNGVIHWIIDRSIESSVNPYSILTFNVVEESFGKVPLPGDIDYDPDVLGSTKLITLPKSGRERLGFVHYDQSAINLWAMEEDNVVESWRVVLSLDRNIGYKNLINVRESGEVVVEVEDGHVVSLDPQSERMKLISDKILGYQGTYVECLVLL